MKKKTKQKTKKTQVATTKKKDAKWIHLRLIHFPGLVQTFQ